MEWTGKVVLITGASRGVGEALARRLAAAGASVALAARAAGVGEGALEEVAASIAQAGGSALPVPTDLSDEAQVAAMVDTTAAHFGRLDMLVNNAAMTGNSTDLFSDIALLRRGMAIDLWAPLLAARAAVPHMRAAGGGRIVNVTSLVGLAPIPNLMMYGVSKLGLERLTLDLAQQLRGDAIACNAFRIDLPVRERAELENPRPGMRAKNLDYAEPAEVAAEGIAWMLEQGTDYTGRLESMRFLREREGIMPTQAKKIFPLRQKIAVPWP